MTCMLSNFNEDSNIVICLLSSYVFCSKDVSGPQRAQPHSSENTHPCKMGCFIPGRSN